MTKIDTHTIKALERNFRELIIKQCQFCGFDKYLEDNPDFEFPKITEELLSFSEFITIPGLFGGFDYYLEEVHGDFVLYAEQSSRMDASSDDYMYFEITETGSRLLKDDEREVVQKKFWELGQKRHEERKRRLKDVNNSGEKV